MKGKSWAGLITTGLMFLGTASGAATNYTYVRIPTTLVTKDFVAGTGFIRDHKWDDTYSFGYVKKGTKAALPREIVELDAWDWATHDYDAKTLQLRPNPMDAVAVGPYEEFHTYETLTTELKALAAKYPQYVKLESAGKTVDGRDLWYIRVSSDFDPHKPKLLYISSMHGDEVTGKEMMVYLLRELTGSYGKDARISALVNNAELWIMPSMNPDGTERRQRFNANGVDLNRDFPNPEDEQWSVAGRAVETVALMELQRNNHFLVAMNYHGGSLCINIPWDGKPNPESDRFGDDAAMMKLAHTYADANGPMSQVNMGSFHGGITYGYEWYQVLGGMQDWSNFFRQSIHATLEISDTKWPSASSLPQFWTENRESLLGYFEGGLNGAHLKVTDASGKPLDVDVDVSTANRTLHYTGGYVHRVTVDGALQVTVRSAGYQPKTLSLTATRFDGKYTDVVLTR